MKKEHISRNIREELRKENREHYAQIRDRIKKEKGTNNGLSQEKRKEANREVGRLAKEDFKKTKSERLVAIKEEVKKANRESYEVAKEERKKDRDKELKEFTIGNLCYNIGVRSFKRGSSEKGNRPTITRTEFLRTISILEWMTSLSEEVSLREVTSCLKKTYESIRFQKQAYSKGSIVIEYETADPTIYDTSLTDDEDFLLAVL